MISLFNTIEQGKCGGGCLEIKGGEYGYFIFYFSFIATLALDIKFLANILIQLDISDPRKILASVEARSAKRETLESKGILRFSGCICVLRIGGLI